MRASFLAPTVLAACVLAAGCSKHASAERRLAAADADLAAGRLDAAEVEYQLALQVIPGHPRALTQLGRLYFEEGRWGAALVYLSHAVTMEPKEADLHSKLAWSEETFGKADDARGEAVKALQFDPADMRAWVVVASTLTTPKAVEDATQLLAASRARVPDCGAFHLAAALLRLQAHDSRGALAELDEGIRIAPRDGELWHQRGLIRSAAGDRPGAETDLRQAMSLGPVRSLWRTTYIDFEAAGKDDAEARRVADQLVQAAPDFVPGLVSAMKLAFKQHRNADCAALAAKVLIRSPENFDGLLTSANLKLLSGDAKEAVKGLRHIDQLYQHSPTVKLQLAQAYLQAGDDVSAEDNLEEAVDRDPSFDPAALMLAELRLNKGNPAAAIVVLNGLLQRRPGVARAYLLLAQAYREQQDPRQAIAVYQHLQGLVPNDPQPTYLAGTVLSQLGLTDDARKLFERAVAIGPGYVPPVEALVTLDIQRREYARALARIDRLIAHFAKSAAPWLLRAKVHLAQARNAEAETDFLKAIELEPASQNAYLLLARLYITTRQYPQAIAKLTAVTDRTPTVRALMELALIRSELGQYPAAAAAYQRVLALDAGFTPALNNLAYLDCEHLGRLDHARELAEQARRLKPTDAYAADTLGWVLYRQGQYREAFTLLLESSDQRPADPELKYHLGMVQSMLGDADLARVALANALADPEPAPWKADAQDRLALLNVDTRKAGAGLRTQLEQAERKSPHDPVVLAHLAEIQQRSGAYAEAAANDEAVLRINPRDVPTMVQLVRLYDGPLRDPAKALAWAKQAHGVEPGNAVAVRLLADLLCRTGDFAWSISLIEGLAEGVSPALWKDLADDYYHVGRIADARSAAQHWAQSDPAARPEAEQFLALAAAAESPATAAAAEPTAEEILRRKPADFPARMVEALALESRGHDREAADKYESMLADSSRFAPAARRLAGLYGGSLHDDDKAYARALLARQTDRSDPELPAILAAVAYRRADFADTARWGRLCLDAGGTDPIVYFYLGMAHYKLGNLKDSKAELARALELKLVGAQAADAQKTLRELEKTGA